MLTFFSSTIVESAFLIVKPHANTELVRNLIREVFRTKKIKIVSEGNITSKEIRDQEMVERHFIEQWEFAKLSDPAVIRFVIYEFLTVDLYKRTALYTSDYIFCVADID